MIWNITKACTVNTDTLISAQEFATLCVHEIYESYSLGQGAAGLWKTELKEPFRSRCQRPAMKCLLNYLELPDTKAKLALLPFGAVGRTMTEKSTSKQKQQKWAAESESSAVFPLENCLPEELTRSGAHFNRCLYFSGGAYSVGFDGNVSLVRIIFARMGLFMEDNPNYKDKAQKMDTNVAERGYVRVTIPDGINITALSGGLKTLEDFLRETMAAGVGGSVRVYFRSFFPNKSQLSNAVKFTRNRLLGTRAGLLYTRENLIRNTNCTAALKKLVNSVLIQQDKRSLLYDSLFLDEETGEPREYPSATADHDWTFLFSDRHTGVVEQGLHIAHLQGKQTWESIKNTGIRDGKITPYYILGLSIQILSIMMRELQGYPHLIDQLVQNFSVRPDE